jgi:tetratricopeptide (TPR) repeat protein
MMRAKQWKYAEAIPHLEKAVSLDPENQDARMYLANAYAKQYNRGVDTPENTHVAEQAIRGPGGSPTQPCEGY